MVDTMYGEKGIGLAAPQVGVSKRLIVALRMRDPDDDEAEPLVLVNPRAVSTTGELWSYEEGCLSIPDVKGQVRRATGVEVEYQDVDGAERRISATGMFARILLHEIDHLDGRLFIDYLSTAQKSIVKARLKELSEDWKSS